MVKKFKRVWFYYEIEKKNLLIIYQLSDSNEARLFDIKWSPAGFMFASTDQEGYLNMFGLGNERNFKQIPKELFFDTDYLSSFDVLNQIFHQSNNLTLVDSNGLSYKLNVQKLIPKKVSIPRSYLKLV